ncbi:MAG: SpoIID/LytB domain-containing protein [Lachnospiraceae bacterium]
MRKAGISVLLITVIFLIPFFVSYLFCKEQEKTTEEQLKSGIPIVVEVDGEKQEMDLEEYLIGILPSQISLDASEEMLKVQSVIARTNVQKQREETGSNQSSDLGFSFVTKQEMTRIWGREKTGEYRAKLMKAVRATFGQVLLYDDQYIDALYHGVSTGETVSAKEYLGEEIPYLVSVDAGYDIEAPDYLTAKEWEVEEVAEILKEYSLVVPDSIIEKELSVGEKSEMGYVKTVVVGDRTVSGEDWQEMFGLNSPNFYIEMHKKKVRMVAIGKGHGMGLSQYSAQQLLKKGENYQSVLTYFYPGTLLVAY